MSSYEINQRSLVHGYIRECTELFSIFIPIEVIKLFLLFFYEMMSVFEGENSGYYEWKIFDSQLINKILNAENSEQFDSDLFTVCNLQWRAEIFPNGDDTSNEGDCNINLRLVTLPSELRVIYLQTNHDIVQ